jgi:hypothetical protein
MVVFSGIWLDFYGLSSMFCISGVVRMAVKG